MASHGGNLAGASDTGDEPLSPGTSGTRAGIPSAEGFEARADDGVTDVPGLYFLGLPWQHTRGSALLGFVHDDAAHDR